MIRKLLCWIGLHSWVAGFELSPHGGIRVVYRCERCPAVRDNPPASFR